MQRPAKPVAKPVAKPAAKPAAARPSAPRTTPRATTRPGGRPAVRTGGTVRRPSSGRGATVLRPTTMLAAVLVVLALLVAPSARTWITQRQQLAAQQQEVEDLRRRVQELRAERARWDDPAYVKAQAGERLNFVMPGQTRYTLLDDTNAGAAERDPRLGAEAAAVASSDLPWYGAVWESAKMAGDTGTP